MWLIDKSFIIFQAESGTKESHWEEVV